MAHLEFPLTGGLDESTNRKVLAAPRLRSVTNGRIRERGMVRKRRGTDAFANGTIDSGTPTPVGPVRLVSHGRQTLVTSEDSLLTVGANGTRLEELDVLPTLTLERVTRLGHYGNVNVVAAACAQSSVLRVYAWATFDGTSYELHIQATDLDRGAGPAATKVPLAQPTQAVKCLKAIALGSKVTVFWGESTFAIRYIDITSSTKGPFLTTTGITLVSDAVQTSPQWFDVAPHSTDEYVLVYRSAVGFYKVQRRSAISHSQTTTNTFALSAGAGPIFGIAGNSTTNNIAVVIGNTDASPANAFTVYWYDDNIAQTNTRGFTPGVTLGAIAVRSIAVARFTAGASGDIVVGVDSIQGAGALARLMTVDESDLLNDKTSQRLYNASINAKPWSHNNEVFCSLRYYASQANSFIGVVKMYTGQSARAFGYYAALETQFRAGQGPGTPLDDSAGSVIYSATAPGVAIIPVAAVERYSPPGTVADPTGDATVDTAGGESTGNQALSIVGLDAFEFNHQSRSRWMTAQVGQYTCFSGGLLTAFDGRRALEIGWAAYPEVASTNIAQTNSTGTLVNGTYQYGFCWEQVDYLGNRSQSAMKTVTDKEITGTNDTFTISQVRPLKLSRRQWNTGGDDSRKVVLAVYRSPEDVLLLNRLEGGGAALFAENVISGITSTVDNYVDGNNSDTMNLAARELSYSTFGAGELQNMMTPASNIVCGHENRLFFVWAEYPNVVGYTKQQFPGTALAWNATLVIVFDDEVQALASQDGNLIAFAETRIFTVRPTPADNTGASTGYDPPQLLSGQLGCKAGSARSVLATPIGVVFESRRGIEVLPRGGGDPQFIGDAVRDTFEDFPIITSVLHVPENSEILWSCVTAESVSGTGIVLVFDYRNQVWFTRNYQDKPITDMVLTDGDVVFGIYDSSSALTLWKEDGGFDDGNDAWQGLSFELSDIMYSGPNSGQRVNRATFLGECLGACGISTEESVDSGETWREKRTRLMLPHDTMQHQHDVVQCKARAHSFRVSEVEGTTVDTEGFALAMVRIDGQGFAAASKLPTFRRV